MPLPLIPIVLGISAAAAAGTGFVKGGQAIAKNSEAKNLNENAKTIYNEAKSKALKSRDDSNKALEIFGKTKLIALDGSVKSFLEVFNKIHNVEFKNCPTFENAKDFNKENFVYKMHEMSMLASSVLGGIVGGAGTGALAAFGAYGATMTFATASTGTAIASLSGVAATNATLAFLGGGALAAGGGGMALGSMVLGGVVAGPALAILGFVMNASASKNLDNAYSNLAEAKRTAEELRTVQTLCDGIKKRSEMFTDLLKNLDSMLVSSANSLETIVQCFGTDYSTYNENAQNIVASSVSLVQAIKSVLDTPILNEDGTLTDESMQTYEKLSTFLESAE